MWDEVFSVGDALWVGGKFGVVVPVLVEGLAEFGKLLVVATGEDEVAVLGAKDLVGDDVGVGVAKALGAFLGGKVVHANVA